MLGALFAAMAGALIGQGLRDHGVLPPLPGGKDEKIPFKSSGGGGGSTPNVDPTIAENIALRKKKELEELAAKNSPMPEAPKAPELPPLNQSTGGDTLGARLLQAFGKTPVDQFTQAYNKQAVKPNMGYPMPKPSAAPPQNVVPPPQNVAMPPQGGMPGLPPSPQMPQGQPAGAQPPVPGQVPGLANQQGMLNKLMQPQQNPGMVGQMPALNQSNLMQQNPTAQNVLKILQQLSNNRNF